VRVNDVTATPYPIGGMVSDFDESDCRMWYYDGSIQWWITPKMHPFLSLSSTKSLYIEEFVTFKRIFVKHGAKYITRRTEKKRKERKNTLSS
jgi:hypothetical protein